MNIAPYCSRMASTYNSHITESNNKKKSSPYNSRTNKYQKTDIISNFPYANNHYVDFTCISKIKILLKIQDACLRPTKFKISLVAEILYNMKDIQIYNAFYTSWVWVLLNIKAYETV